MMWTIIQQTLDVVIVRFHSERLERFQRWCGGVCGEGCLTCGRFCGQKYPVDQMRPWPFQLRRNDTYRPVIIDVEADGHKSVSEIADSQSPWTIFLEVISPDDPMTVLPNFDKEGDVLLFFKLYDPKNKRIYYCGHHYMKVSAKVRKSLSSMLFPLCIPTRAFFPKCVVFPD